MPPIDLAPDEGLVRSGATRHAGTCGRCGLNGGMPHGSELECLRAVDAELRRLRARSLWLRDQRVELLRRHVYQWQDARDERAVRTNGGKPGGGVPAGPLATAARTSDPS
jgi:hypothetical protein